MTLAFVDVETTGLDPERHEVWEVGLIVRSATPPDSPITPGDIEMSWMLPVDCGRADAYALGVGGFHERHRYSETASFRFVAGEIAQWTRGATIVGANPAFDVAFLSRLLRSNGSCPEWHYRMVDVESLVAGHLHHPIRGLKDSAIAVGIDVDRYETHTALGDARLARDIHDAVMSVAVPQTEEALSA